MAGRDRLSKVLAVAISPAAYEQEAIAALQKARELVRRDPDLAFSLLPGEHPLSCGDLADEASFEVNVSGIHDFWLPILLNTLSEQAYVLGLKSQLTCDFATPTTVHVKCNGSETSCKAFDDYLHVLMEYIESRQCEP